jgi:hypothetical protein
MLTLNLLYIMLFLIIGSIKNRECFMMPKAA